MARVWILLAAILGASGVAIGAYHAHGLQQHLERSGFTSDEINAKMDNCETAIRYQMYHVFALISVGILVSFRRSILVNLAGVLFVCGVIGFSGGLYLMVFFDNMIHWAIVPSGGLLMILGWIVFGLGGIVTSNRRSDDR